MGVRGRITAWGALVALGFAVAAAALASALGAPTEQARRNGPLLTEHLVLQTMTMRAGGTLAGKMVVDNRSGRDIPVPTREGF